MFHLRHIQKSISVAGSLKHRNRCRGSSFQEEIIQHVCVYCIRQQRSSIQKNHFPMSSFHLDFKGPIQNLCHSSPNTLPGSLLRVKNHNFYLLFLRMTGKQGKQLGLFLIDSLLQNNVIFFWCSWALPRQNIHSLNLLNSLVPTLRRVVTYTVPIALLSLQVPPPPDSLPFPLSPPTPHCSQHECKSGDTAFEYQCIKSNPDRYSQRLQVKCPLTVTNGTPFSLQEV